MSVEDGRGSAVGRFFTTDGDAGRDRRPGGHAAGGRGGRMSSALGPTGHVDTFARDHLPPADQWPVLEFTTPALALPRAAQRRRRAPRRGRGPSTARTAPHCACRTAPTWTYGELLERANQVAHVLVDDLGLVPGNRVLLRSPNNSVDRRRLAGRAQGRRGRGHHDGGAARDRADPDRREDAAGRRPRRPPLRRGRTHRRSRPAPRGLRRGRRRRPDPTRHRQAERLRRRRHRGRRRRPLRPDVRHHRRPQDHHALPPRRARHRRHLRPRRAAPRADRRRGVHRSAGLHVRPGHARRVHVARRRLCPPHRGGHPGAARRPRGRARRHGAGDRAHGVQADRRLRARRPAGRAARRRVGGRAHGAGDVGADPRRHRAQGHRRHRRDRDAPHLHLRRRRRHPPRRHRQAGRGLPRGDPRRRRQRARRGRRGAARRDRSGRLPLPRRRTPARLRRQRLERHRRHLPARRRRLLLVPLAHRQHDRLVGLQHRRSRGRGGARHPPRRRRGRRRRRAGRAARLDRVRLRRAARGRRGRRRQGHRAPGPRQGPARSLQVPARGALRRRAAAQHQRQAAALQAAPDGRVNAESEGQS